VDKLLKETVHLVEKEAVNRCIGIETDIRAIDKDILVDPQMLKSALLNILINAMEASQEKGKIRVSLGEDNGWIVISIGDRGEGMPLEVLDRVFDPYFSTKSSGTGLGLSLTKNIIEKHEGNISIESKPGEGTLVTVIIPAKGK
jgi:signal transduction histidine kinase